RDSTALVGQAYVEFDLETMFDSEQFSDFVLLYAMCHESRLARLTNDDGEPGSVGDRWIERWRTDAIASGTRALTSLRGQVEKAIEVLGTGYLSQPANQALRDRLSSGDITVVDYQRALLRLVYRLLFWLVAEDRDVLLTPAANPEAAARYTTYFSSRRLRTLARTRIGTRHHDLAAQVELVFTGLGATGGLPQLGLPGLGGIFEPSEIDVLAGQALANHSLLEAIRLLSTTRDAGGHALRSVDFRHLGAEELGGIYEGLLELHPRIDPVQRTFTLAPGAGNERKTSGSYYTPSSLIDLVLDNALDPLLDRATTGGSAIEQEAALLALRVCDPACGSGHFLVAAARRIANRLARLRSGETEPSATQAQNAIHDVVAQCIYGVDLNPMAAELARVSLWLEAIQPGRPLGFLDAHIKVGNSLLGTTPALLAAGIPDGAFAPITGDDKPTATKWKKRNAIERDQSNQMSFLEHNLAAFTNSLLVDATLALNALPVLTLDDVALQRQRYEELRDSPELRKLKSAADSWAAAFFQKKTTTNPIPITTGTVRMLEANDKPAEAIRDAVAGAAAAHRFFHWHIEFPDIFSVPDEPNPNTDPDTGWIGGFDVMVGNPPWERVKIQEKEFFGERDPDIADAPNAAARRRLIAALTQTNPILAQQFEAAERDSEAESQYIRTSGRYPLTGRGDVNTYSIFAETFRTVINPMGRAGVITPTGLATDATTAPFFADTLRTRRLAAFYDFENEAKIFAGVHNQLRFACTTFGGVGVRIGQVRMAFYTRYVEDVRQREYELTPAEILLLNPNTGTLPMFRTRKDADITLAMYRRHGVLWSDHESIGNPWGLSFMRMFDMANDSHRFRTPDELRSCGAIFDGWVWHSEDDSGGTLQRWLPLYEGKMLSHYNHRFATYAGASQAQLNKGTLPLLSARLLADPTLESVARYWVPEDEVASAANARTDRGWLFGWRDITKADQLRTMIPTVFPLSAVGNKFPLAFLGDPKLTPLLHAIWSSMAFDYVARKKLSGTNLAYFILKQVSCPEPRVFFEPPAWSDSDLAAFVVPRVIELSYTSRRLSPYAEDHGYDGEPFKWHPERRASIQCELDAAMTHVYGLQRDEVEHVLDSFLVLRKYEERDHGEFRTRRLVLDYYDRMATAAETGIPYQTPIDPPPGQGPRHAPRTAASKEPGP
ncbi:MAG: N-6 DNA methylase, partial [Actinomycetes bacterium]